MSIFSDFKNYKHRGAVKGAVFGAGLGGWSGASMAHEENRYRKPEEKVSPLKWGLTGAAAGMGLGGLAGHTGDRARIRREESDRAFKESMRKAREHSDRMHEEYAKRRREYDETWKKYWDNHHKNNSNNRGRGSGSGGRRGYGGFGHDFSDHRPHLKTLGLSGSEKSKKEVESAYKSMAKKHHPDRGGDTKKMQEVNNAFDEVKKSDWFQKLAFERGFLKVYRV